MKKQIAIKLGIIGGVGLASAIAYLIIKKKRDNAATQFYHNMEIELDPVKNAGNSSAFDINLLSKIEEHGTLITPGKANEYAETIASGISKLYWWGGFSSAFDEIIAVFRSLQSKVQVSQVAAKYYANEDINILDAFEGGLSNDHYQEIMSIVTLMPEII